MGRPKVIKSDDELEIESKILLNKKINKSIDDKIKQIQYNFGNNNTVSIP